MTSKACTATLQPLHRGRSSSLAKNQNTQRKAWGRTIDDLWIDGKRDNLHPAEVLLLERAARGQECQIGSEQPDRKTPENTIRGEFLRFIALGGDANHPVHEQGIVLRAAWIAGKLNLAGCNLSENITLVDCNFDGEISLMDASAETIVMSGCTVKSLFAPRMELSGSFALGWDSKISGQVSLNNSKIAGNLDLRGAVFLGETNEVAANGIRVDGHVYLEEGFIAQGKVTIENAFIGTGISCRGAQFQSTDRALSLKSTTIDGNVDFGVWKNKDFSDGRLACCFRGAVSLQRAQINGDLVFTETRFERSCSVNLRNATIKGQLYWRQIKQSDDAQGTDDKKESTANASDTNTPSSSELNLAGASCLTLNMDWDSWNLPGQIRLDHFTYSGFSELPAAWNADRWIKWLERQPGHHLNKRFRPHPYQQLAKVLDAAGFEEEGTKIRIERRERQRLFARDYEPVSSGVWPWTLRRLNNFWRWLQKIFVGHGYRPGTAVIWLLCLIGAGTLVYDQAARQGIMTPTHPLIFKEATWTGPLDEVPTGKIPAGCRQNWVHPKPDDLAAACEKSVPSEYSTFSPFVYSLDTAIPVVNFRMESDWSPRVVNWETGKHDPAGWWVRTWEWFQIGVGWGLSLLFVSAIGGIIRRD